ncbi:MAG: hypothetical protein ACLP8A_08165 [Methylovirgula sp.]
MNITPPEGLSEDDYEAIEAAVLETVRGRWFLAEYARRSRVDEMRQLLDAVGRLEQVVVEQRTLPADPAIRLLVQRLKEVSAHLDGLAGEMRAHGSDADFCARLEAQARAVGGLLRLNGSAPPAAVAPVTAAPVATAPIAPIEAPPLAPALPEPAPMAPEPVPKPAVAAAPPQGLSRDEIRRATLARIDAMSLAEKFALFN